MRHPLPILLLCLAAVAAPLAQADGRGNDRGYRDWRGDRPGWDDRGDRGDRGARGERDDRGRGRVAGGRISLDQAVSRAERQYGARAVRAERKRDGDRDVYRIRLLAPDGRVFNVTVDAETGAIR